jgi:hypothetical protein
MYFYSPALKGYLLGLYVGDSAGDSCTLRNINRQIQNATRFSTEALRYWVSVRCEAAVLGLTKYHNYSSV